ncbi:MAG: 3-deoxy-D-manno-octulosonic-acid transferase [Rickettsiales bacterium]|jgi:3-deoxy-D-manno-octulosonic-acid transferase
MIFLYQTLSILLSPLLTSYLIFRKFKKKEDPLRFAERFGYSKIKRPEGFLIWLHAASVGESKSALTLAKGLLEQDPNNRILITSGTITSAAQIAKNIPKRTIHQYVPIDTFFAVRRFLKHWKPDLAMFVESELWPNLIVQTKCPLTLVNGRISDQSFKYWKILHEFGFNLLEKFNICFAQSKIDQQKFIDLGIKNVHFVGNLKSANDPLKIDQEKLEQLKKQIGMRKFWLAASTHKGEEEIIIKAHQNLKKYFPDLITIIAPRHPNRLEEFTGLIPKNLKISLHSKNQSIANCDIYLVDVLGDLGTFYSLSKISLICGSLIDNIGGHNPFEALQLGSVVLSGKYVKNFQETYQDLTNAKNCIIANDEQELLFYLIKMIKDEDYYLSLIKDNKNLNTNSNKTVSQILQSLNQI